MIPHYSFEMPNLGAGFQYTPSYCSNLYFQNGAGIGQRERLRLDECAGRHAGGIFLRQRCVDVNVSGLTMGASYTVKFKATKRPYRPVNQVYISFQGNNLGVHTPTPDTSFQQFTTTSFTANSSTGVLTIVGLTAGPIGTGVDDIQITSP